MTRYFLVPVERTQPTTGPLAGRSRWVPKYADEIGYGYETHHGIPPDKGFWLIDTLPFRPEWYAQNERSTLLGLVRDGVATEWDRDSMPVAWRPASAAEIQQAEAALAAALDSAEKEHSAKIEQLAAMPDVIELTDTDDALDQPRKAAALARLGALPIERSDTGKELMASLRESVMFKQRGFADQDIADLHGRRRQAVVDAAVREAIRGG